MRFLEVDFNRRRFELVRTGHFSTYFHRAKGENERGLGVKDIPSPQHP